MTFPIIHKAARRFNTPKIAELLAIDVQVKALLDRAYKIRKGCRHEYEPRNEAVKKEKDPSSFAICRHCGLMSYLWWCPKSSDGVCDYDEEHGEYCIHCQLPAERK